MKKKKLFIFLVLLGIFIIWSLILFYYSPQRIVEKIGLNNSYFLLSLMAFLGGTSIFLPFPYYIFTVSFGAAGLNPFLLGIAAGIGTLIGDSTSYYIAYRGRELAPDKLSKFFEIFFNWFMKNHPSFLPIFAFIYASITPFSDDLIMVPAGLMKYPFIRLAISVGLGKIVFNTVLAFSGLYGWNLLFG